MADSSFYINKGPITLAELAKVCAASLKDSSKANVEIKNAATMDKAGEGDVCFFYDKKKKEAAAAIKATACVTTEELLPLIPDNVIKLTVENPKFAFVILINRLYAEPDIARTIAQSAKIAPTASIGESCFIGENAVIEDNVKIGSGCIIEHNAVISKSCQIGNNCRIGSGTVVSHCIMGNDCFVYRNVSIGQDGFGFVMMEGRHKKILQLGRVIIGNDVEIGAGTCVDRGALDDTIIGDGCRIDNLVQVAHNIVLGRGCVLVGQTGIAGSCTFGDYVVTGGQTGFADHLNIGSGAQIAAQSGIMRDIEPGAVVMGTPAVPIKDFMRQVSFLQKSANPKK